MYNDLRALLTLAHHSHLSAGLALGCCGQIIFEPLRNGSRSQLLKQLHQRRVVAEIVSAKGEYIVKVFILIVYNRI